MIGSIGFIKFINLYDYFLKLILFGVKNTASIFILVIIFYNLIGYNLLANYVENEVSSEFQSKLDKDLYSESDLIHFKIPVYIPYVSGSLDFKKTNGIIEIKGVTYQFVKKRIYKDTLEIFCLPNKERTAIRKAKDLFLKIANDFENQSNSKKPGSSLVHKIKLSTYNFKLYHFSSSILNTDFKGRKCDYTQYPPALSAHLRSFDQPPEV